MPASLTQSEKGNQWDAVEIDDLPTVNAVESALEASSKASQNVEDRLDALVSRMNTTNSSRGAILAGISQTAAVVSDDAAEVVSLLDAVSRTAQGISSQIRFLGDIIARGTEALSRVENVLTLRVCAEGAKTALSAGDLAAATGHAQRYLSLDDDVRKDEASLSAVAQMTQSLAELTRKIRERAETEAEDMAQADLETFSLTSCVAAVKLFVPIGLADEGLKRLSTCVRSQIAREADADLRTTLMESNTGDEPSGTVFARAGESEPHIIVLVRLFEAVASYLHESEAPVVEVFGHQSMVDFAQSLQAQCDLSSDRILIRYKEARNLEDVSRAVRAESANARDLDLLLTEIAILSQRIATYLNFMVRRCKAVITATNDANDNRPKPDSDEAFSRTHAVKPKHLVESKPPVLPSKEHAEVQEQSKITSGALHTPDSIEEVFGSSKLSWWLRNVTTTYVEFEAYFLRENARKAIRIDELSEEGALTSTAVDDFFFVLQKVVGRSITFGGDVDALIQMLHHMNICIGTDLVGYIRSRLRETESALEKTHGPSTSSSSLPSAASTVSYLAEFAKANIPKSGSSSAAIGSLHESSDSAKYDYFVALNNATVSADYAVRFGASVEQSVQKHHSDSEDTRMRVNGPLSQISDTARTLGNVSEHAVARLAAILTSRIAAPMERFLSERNYEISESSMSLVEDGGSSGFAGGFLEDMESNVLSVSIEKRLTEAAWDAVVREVSVWTAGKVESALFLPAGSSSGSSGTFTRGKRMTALGGLQADRDVRSLSAYFAGKCRQGSVRDVFARLSQIALLINLEQPAEVYDIWGGNSGGMTWRLSTAEVRQALRLRVDFKEEAIRQLKL